MVQYQKFYLRLSLVSFVLALGVIVVAVLWVQPAQSSHALELAFLGATCLLPVVWAALRRRLDIFEPIYAFALSTFVYFVLVPAILVRQRAFTLMGVDFSSELSRVTALAFLASLGFAIGYYGRWLVRETSGASGTATRLEPELRRYLYRWAVALFTFFTLLIGLWILIARMPLYSLWIFGQASYNDAWTMASGPQIGYLYGAREALPACLLLIIAFRGSRRWPRTALLLMVLMVLFFSGSGARFRVLLVVLSVIIFYYLERGKRPRTWQTLLVSFIIFYFVIGGIGFYRSKTYEGNTARGRTVTQDALSINDAWDVMLGSSQIAVSTGALVRVVPAYHPYFGGTSFLNLFTQPIPRFLWPDKPQTIGEEFFSQLWAPGTTVPFWTLFYLNFGPIGVVVGMAVWGWLSRWIYDACFERPADPLAQAKLAVYWPFLIHMYGRGGDNFAFNFYGLIVVLFPVWFMQWLVRRWQIRRARVGPHQIGTRANGMSWPSFDLEQQ